MSVEQIACWKNIPRICRASTREVVVNLSITNELNRSKTRPPKYCRVSTYLLSRTNTEAVCREAFTSTMDRWMDSLAVVGILFCFFLYGPSS